MPTCALCRSVSTTKVSLFRGDAATLGLYAALLSPLSRYKTEADVRKSWGLSFPVFTSGPVRPPAAAVEFFTSLPVTPTNEPVTPPPNAPTCSSSAISSLPALLCTFLGGSTGSLSGQVDLGAFCPCPVSCVLCPLRGALLEPSNKLSVRLTPSDFCKPCYHSACSGRHQQRSSQTACFCSFGTTNQKAAVLVGPFCRPDLWCWRFRAAVF